MYVFLLGVLSDNADLSDKAKEFRPDRMLDGKFEKIPVRFLRSFQRNKLICIFLAQRMAAIWIRTTCLHRELFGGCTRERY